jgi:hypothetical protein
MENFIEKIIDEKKVDRGRKYLVRWVGFGADEDEWSPRRDKTAKHSTQNLSSSAGFGPAQFMRNKFRFCCGYRLAQIS